MSGGEWEQEIEVPANATAAEEEALIDEAIDRKIGDDLDDMLRGLGDSFK